MTARVELLIYQRVIGILMILRFGVFDLFRQSHGMNIHSPATLLVHRMYPVLIRNFGQMGCLCAMMMANYKVTNIGVAW